MPIPADAYRTGARPFTTDVDDTVLLTGRETPLASGRQGVWFHIPTPTRVDGVGYVLYEFIASGDPAFPTCIFVVDDTYASTQASTTGNLTSTLTYQMTTSSSGVSIFLGGNQPNTIGTLRMQLRRRVISLGTPVDLGTKTGTNTSTASGTRPKLVADPGGFYGGGGQVNPYPRRSSFSLPITSSTTNSLHANTNGQFPEENAIQRKQSFDAAKQASGGELAWPGLSFGGPGDGVGWDAGETPTNVVDKKSLQPGAGYTDPANTAGSFARTGWQTAFTANHGSASLPSTYQTTVWQAFIAVAQSSGWAPALEWARDPRLARPSGALGDPVYVQEVQSYRVVAHATNIQVQQSGITMRCEHIAPDQPNTAPLADLWQESSGHWGTSVSEVAVSTGHASTDDIVGTQLTLTLGTRLTRTSTDAQQLAPLANGPLDWFALVSSDLQNTTLTPNAGASQYVDPYLEITEVTVHATIAWYYLQPYSPTVVPIVPLVCSLQPGAVTPAMYQSMLLVAQRANRATFYRRSP